jgi:hypothetical protein
MTLPMAVFITLMISHVAIGVFAAYRLKSTDTWVLRLCFLLPLAAAFLYLHSIIAGEYQAFPGDILYASAFIFQTVVLKWLVMRKLKRESPKRGRRRISTRSRTRPPPLGRASKPTKK